MALYGSGDWHCVTRQRKWTAGQGYTMVEQYRGPRQYINNLLGSLTPGYISIEWPETGNMVVVTVTWATVDFNGTTAADPILTSWELDGKMSELIIASHPQYKPIRDRWAYWPMLIDSRVSRIRSAYDSSGTSSTAPAPVVESSRDDYPVSGATAEEQTLAKDLTDLLLKNQAMSFFSPEWVLTKTQLVTSLTLLRISTTNLGRMHRHTTLQGYEPTMPSFMLIDATGLGDLYWLKMAPRVAPTQNGLYNIIQEYWSCREFETKIYGEAI